MKSQNRKLAGDMLLHYFQVTFGKATGGERLDLDCVAEITSIVDMIFDGVREELRDEELRRALDLETTDSRPGDSPTEGPFNRLAKEVVSINRANGWNVCTPDDWDRTQKLGTALALIHSEVSEALEAMRINDRGNFEEELADVLIRVLDLAGGLGIDLDAAVVAKLEKNRSRGIRHGGKRV